MLKEIANGQLFQPKYTNLCQSYIHTDGAHTTIKLLKTNLNSLICLLEIDQGTFLKYYS